MPQSPSLTTTMPKTLATLFVALSLFAASCSGSSSAPAANDDFLSITDCAELELRISEEVDRISTTNDRDIVDAATNLFQRIVAHRNAIC